MDELLAHDLDTLRDLLGTTATQAADFLEEVTDRPVVPDTSGLTSAAASLPTKGVGGRRALERFRAEWQPSMTASAGPRFQGFVTGGATPASVAGDWLVSAMDQNVAGADGGAAALETQTVDWIAQLLGLGGEHRGAMTTGAATANLTALAVAREWIGRRQGVEVNDVGVAALGGVRVFAGCPHSCIPKALSVLGLGRRSLELVGLLPEREAVDVDALERTVAGADGPVIVAAGAGTVNTVDFDDLAALVELRDRYGFWLHVDAAFGAFAALDERYSHLVERMGEADSIAVDLHKWLNVPYDAAVVYTRHRDLQVSVFRNISDYLAAPGAIPDYLHLVPENSRRFRALPAWLTLVAYGREGHAEIVRRNNDAAAHFGARIAEMAEARLLAPVRMNVVCFTTDAPTSDVLRALADSGEGFLTPTQLDGQPAIRAAFSNWRTTVADADRLADAVVAVMR